MSSENRSLFFFGLEGTRSSKLMSIITSLAHAQSQSPRDTLTNSYHSLGVSEKLCTILEVLICYSVVSSVKN